MGDPKKHRKKYSSPTHPWQKARIDEEKQLVKEYGFRNKTEIWKMERFLKDATNQAKKLVTLIGPQADKEKELLLQRLRRYGLLSPEAGLADILSITLRDVLERRLQTQVYKQNLANSVKQARQFITHKHIAVAGKVITSPSYLVPVSEEGQISFRPTSSMSDIEHPERVAARKAKEKASEESVIDKDDDKAKPGSRIGQRSGQKSGPGARRPGEDRRGGAKDSRPTGRR